MERWFGWCYLGPSPVFESEEWEGRWVFPSVPTSPALSFPPLPFPTWHCWLQSHLGAGFGCDSILPKKRYGDAVTHASKQFSWLLSFLCLEEILSLIHNRWVDWLLTGKGFLLPTDLNKHPPPKKSTKIHTILILSRAYILKLFLKMLHKGHIKLILELQSEMC